MKVLDPGHDYELHNLDGSGSTSLRFVKREGPGYPGNAGSHEGTNLQEVLRAVIDRVSYLDNQIPDGRNTSVVRFLRLSLLTLELRAAERHERALAVPLEGIELLPFCSKCGHVGCLKTCEKETTRG